MQRYSKKVRFIAFITLFYVFFYPAPSYSDLHRANSVPAKSLRTTKKQVPKSSIL